MLWLVLYKIRSVWHRPDYIIVHDFYAGNAG